MIVCASDYVGYKAVDFLIECGEQIAFLILDKSDISPYPTAYVYDNGKNILLK